MRALNISLLALLALPLIAGSAESSPAPAYTSAPGLYPVEVVKYDWKDASRDRKVPMKIYYPGGNAGPFPVIIFSHGLGGSRDGYEYLGRHWASCGYVSVHLQHVGSDDSVWMGVPPWNVMKRMREAATSMENLTNRPADVSFTIDQLEQLNDASGPLHGKLDMKNIAVAGHSFGAFTTLAIAGETFVTPGGKKVRVADPRVKAAISMSAPAPLRGSLDEAFGSIRIPVFHMTGTRDDSPIGETKAADRRLPYDHAKNSDEYLVIFQDGDHMIFSGRAAIAGGRKDKKFQEQISASSTAFWDAYLKTNQAAKAWLGDGGFKRALGSEGTFEVRLLK